MVNASRQGKRRMETSKKILLVLGLAWVILMGVGTALAWFREDSSVLRIIATGTSSGLSVAIGFYYWKAKQENLLKLKAAYKEDFVAAEEERGQSIYYEGGRDISGGV